MCVLCYMQRHPKGSLLSAQGAHLAALCMQMVGEAVSCADQVQGPGHPARAGCQPERGHPGVRCCQRGQGHGRAQGLCQGSAQHCAHAFSAPAVWLAGLMLRCWLRETMPALAAVMCRRSVITVSDLSYFLCSLH